jgi:gliding motility-associated-like protein
MNQRILLLSAFFLASQWVLSGQNYIMNGTPINDCNGFFLDSGGGNGAYGPNENFTTTICPDLSTGTHIRLNFSGVDVAGGDFLCFFDGPDATAPPLGCSNEYLPGAPFIIQATAANPSGCLTVTFTSDASGQGAGWAAAIECIPACQIITAVLNSVLVNSVLITDLTDTTYIDICPGDQVTFSGNGLYPQNGVLYNHSDFTSSFEWTFGDGATGLGLNTSRIYNEPGGYIVQLTITDQFGCTNTNYLSQRVRVATLPEFSLSQDWDNTICVGDTIAIGATVNADSSSSVLTVLPPTEGSFISAGVRSDSLPLPDGTGAAYTSSVFFSQFSPGQVLTDINDLLGICVNMEHSYLRDLEISISCPDGTSVTLHNFAGQTGGEVFLGEPFEADEGFNPPIPGVGFDYCWVPGAPNPTWIQYANMFAPQTLPAGDYSSFQPLTNLLGCPLNGEWTITVNDLWAVDNGYIFSLSVNFDPDIYPALEVFTPNYIDWEWDSIPSITYFSQDSIQASPANAGVAAYSFFIYDDFGCTWETSVPVTILPFTHPDCYNCLDNINPVPDTTVCPGDPVTLDIGVAPQAPAVTFEAYENYSFGFANHPHTNPFLSRINVNSIIPTVITNPVQDIASVCFDLNTNFLSDIIVRLQAPNGVVMELTSNNGGSSDFYTNTCFTPTSIVPITAGVTPFTGNYQPEGAWATLNGAPINGEWRLQVSDGAGLSFFGTFNWWSITFNTQNNINYSWTPNNTLSCTDCPDPVAAPLASTSYFAQSIDSYSCLSYDTIQVLVSPPIPAPVVACDASQAGEAFFSWTQVDTFIQYEVNVNNQGWEPANGPLSHLVTGLPNGALATIQVRVVNDGSFCDALIGFSDCITCTVDVTVVSSSPVLCAGECNGSVQLLGVGGLPPFTFTVMSVDGTYSQTQAANGLFSNLCPGAHIGIVEDVGGCLDTVAFVIGDATPLSLSVVETESVSCFGDNDGVATAIPSGGTGVYSYIWSDPIAQILPSAILLFAGPVSVTVTDGNGCQITGSTVIQQPQELTLTPSSAPVLCFGGATGSGQVSVSGGTYPYSYLWNNPAGTTDSIVANLPAGVYAVEVTDANGCETSATINVTQPAAALTASAVQIDTSCFGLNQGQAQVVASGGTGGPNYAYAWSNGGSSATAGDLAPQNYTVTVTDVNGCQASASVLIAQYQVMQIAVIFSPVSCFGSMDGELAVTAVSGGSNSGILTYSWSSDPNLNSEVISGLAGGQTYGVTVTDDQGCSASQSVALSEPSPMSIQLNAQDALCFGDATGSATVSSVLNATGPVTYEWGPGANSQTTQTALNLEAGSFTVTVTDILGCTASGAIQVNQPPPLNAAFAVSPNPCFGFQTGAASATASGGVGGYQYAWSNGANGMAISALASGWYELTLTDANGCTLVDSVEVTQPDPISPTLTIQNVSCSGGRNGRISAAVEGGTGPFLYSLNGETYTGSSTLVGLYAGDYTLFIRDANGCIWIDDLEVLEPLPLELTILQAPEVTINLGETITLGAFTENNQGPAVITWSAPYDGTLSCLVCDETVSNTENTITYQAFAIDSAGCRAEASVIVRVNKERIILVPTGFSPNGDGVNDRLLVHGQEGTIITTFRIFDRWGELVFEALNFPANDPGIGWDGVFKGQLMNSGAFLWQVDALFIDGHRQSFKGTTTIVR